MKRVFILLVLAMAVTSLGAQELWNGVVTYSNRMVGGGAPTTYTSYHRGADVMTDMPQTKTKTLYLSAEKRLYTVMGMMGKPIVSTREIDPDTMTVPLLEVDDGLETLAGHRCLKVSYESSNAMVSQTTTVWLDTTYHIPFEYSLNEEVPYGLPVRTEMRMKMQGQTMDIVSELVSAVEGKVDDIFFTPPSNEGAVTLSIDAEGNPLLGGDTTGLFAPVHSNLLDEVDSAGFHKAIAHGKTVCMFTAVWCGPCRLMYPRIEAVAKQLDKNYRFIKVDIDRCPTIAKEYGCATIPVLIFFEEGKELRRLTSAAYSQEDILRFLSQ